MRLKFVFLTSMVGAVVGAGVSLAIIAMWRHGLLVASIPTETNRPYVVMVYLPAIAIAVFASIFTYRHTARRRKFQAIVTGVLTVVFWLVTLVTIYFVLR